MSKCCGGSDHDRASEASPETTQEAPKVDEGRRNFVRGALASGSAAVSAATLTLPYVSTAQAQGLDPVKPGMRSHYHVAATDKTVHWGYFSKKLKPIVQIASGDFVSVEAITHHAYDDFERMIKGDPGVESIFYWDKTKKNVNRRGAGPMDASVMGRGAGEGLRRAHLHRPGPHQGRAARRHPGSAHRRRQPASLREPRVQGQDLRQQR